ncbi:MAG: T9SS type A sorting domain-containing protein [Bacteroidetes bacterium]|nr:T9SS type A sorting domain-containing protein [Bacteroidota bacterium]
MKKFFLFIILLFSLHCFSQTYSFTYQSILRSYIVHLPTGYTSSIKYPMIINMHGYTSNASQQEVYSQMDAVADTGKFIVVYPDGVNKAWNAGFGTNPSVDDVGFLSMMIDTMKKNFSVDSTKVYSCGLSNGGFMSFRLACELENKIAAIAPVSGLMSDSTRIFCQSICPIPLMYFHGTADGIVNYNGMSPGYVSVDSTIKIWVGKDACPQTPFVTNVPDINPADNCTVTKYVYSPGQNNSEVVFFKITNGGHTWPGGVPVPSLGNTNEDINASGEIWNFFRKHSLQCGANGVEENYFSEEIIVYPNPSSDFFSLRITNPSELRITEVRLFDIYGKEILIEPIRNSNSFIIRSSKGIYLLKVKTENGISIHKIVKE